MKLLAHRDKYGEIDYHIGRKSHQIIKIYEASSTSVYYTVSYQREEIYTSLSDRLVFESVEAAAAGAQEWVDTKSPVTLERLKEIEEENERVNRIREQLRKKSEKRPAAKREVPPEVIERRKIWRKVKRKINRWNHSHDKELVYEVLRAVVEEMGEEKRKETENKKDHLPDPAE